MTQTSSNIRRVVTTHDADGKAIVLDVKSFNKENDEAKKEPAAPPAEPAGGESPAAEAGERELGKRVGRLAGLPYR